MRHFVEALRGDAQSAQNAFGNPRRKPGRQRQGQRATDCFQPASYRNSMSPRAGNWLSDSVSVRVVSNDDRRGWPIPMRAAASACVSPWT
ncbi:hypothetical protein [Burkholderia territorii]|uniref:hypothetical protein n=1 Tax=Burkholderia territorii TaxID=1503055 RepID=UPI0007B8B57E|nr:hypothetical protein [Burkholderia territorii]